MAAPATLRIPFVKINIVSKADLGCTLNLKKIARKARNAQYMGTYVIMRIGNPRTTALIYSSGKIVCTGARSEEESRLAVRKYARITQELGFNAKVLDFKILKIMGYCDVGFPIRLGSLDLVHRQFCLYEPEVDPDLIYRMVRPSMKMLISSSGKVIFTGAAVRQEVYEAFDYIYPILISFKKQ